MNITTWSVIKQRPHPQVTLTIGDVLLELLALAALVCCFAIVGAAWSRLPETIPMHFNLKGAVDGYGGKSSVLYLPLVAAGLYILLTILNHYPRLYNYPVEITGENAQIQYRLATRFMRLLKFEVVLIFAFLECLVTASALDGQLRSAALLFLPVSLVAVAGSGGYFIFRSVKAK